MNGHIRNIDGEDEELSPPLFKQEIKDGQWMGVTVRSQGLAGKVILNKIKPNKTYAINEYLITIKVLVCAHRYIAKTGESQHGQGLCYVLTNDLKFDDSYEPCKGRNTEREHEEYGYCKKKLFHFS